MDGTVKIIIFGRRLAIKTRKMKRKIISILLGTSLIVGMFAFPVHADSNSSQIRILDEGYEIGNGTANDWVKLRDVDGETALLKVIVNQDDTSAVILEKNGEIKRYQGGEMDYEKYVFDLLHSENKVSHGITTYGSEITGKQYKHVRIGSSTVTLNSEDIAGLLFMGTEVGIETFSKLSAPAKVIAKIALKATEIASNVPNSMKVTSVSYEVKAKDHTGKYYYYTHCYHVQFLSYNSAGVLIDAKNDYYQAVGG